MIKVYDIDKRKIDVFNLFNVSSRDDIKETRKKSLNSQSDLSRVNFYFQE